MTTTFITPASREATRAPARDVIAAWKGCSAYTDPLTIEGPDRSALTLTGITAIGDVTDTGWYIARVTRNDGGRPEFYPISVTIRADNSLWLILHCSDQMPARDRSLKAATTRGLQLIAAARAKALRAEVAAWPEALPFTADVLVAAMKADENYADIADGFTGYEDHDFEAIVLRVAEALSNLAYDTGARIVIDGVADGDGLLGGYSVSVTLRARNSYLSEYVDVKQATHNRGATGWEAIAAIADVLIDHANQIIGTGRMLIAA